MTNKPKEKFAKLNKNTSRMSIVKDIHEEKACT